jgi:hypothetical protein
MKLQRCRRNRRHLPRAMRARRVTSGTPARAHQVRRFFSGCPVCSLRPVLCRGQRGRDLGGERRRLLSSRGGLGLLLGHELPSDLTQEGTLPLTTGGGTEWVPEDVPRPRLASTARPRLLHNAKQNRLPFGSSR